MNKLKTAESCLHLFSFILGLFFLCVCFVLFQVIKRHKSNRPTNVLSKKPFGLKKKKQSSLKFACQY